MKGSNWRDSRMACELFYLNDPTCAEKPYLNPEPEITMVKEFKVKDFKEAIQFTKEWNEKHPEHVHYWRHVHNRGDYGLWHKDGICSWGLSDVDNHFVDKIAELRLKLRQIDKEIANTDPNRHPLHHWSCRHDRLKLVKKIAKIRRISTCCLVRFLVGVKIAVSDWCSWWLKDFWVDKFKDWKWERKRLSTWKKTGHSPDEWWSLELHLLETLKFNLKRIIQDGMGINSVFIEDVLRKRHANEPDFDLEKEFIKFHMGENTGVEEEVVELQKQTYERICHLVDLYTFYLNQEVDDKDIYDHPELRTPDMVETYIDGTYDMIDYKDMLEKGKKCWNEIWDLVKKYGQQMGD